jgi:Uncharacterized protein conserved in bacteria (DUF2066)
MNGDMPVVERKFRMMPWAVLSAAAATWLFAGNALAAAADKPFTIGNYPVEATAADSVAAKEQALADGQKAAFRSLLKRLVPVTSYKRIDKLKDVKAADLIDGVSVRSERNSTTQYIANLDFAFQPRAVRSLLRREGIPFVDLPAPTVVLVPVYQAPAAGQGAAPAALAQAAGQKAWSDAWKGLDLEHSLTPLKLEAGKGALHRDTLQKMTEDGDGGGLRIVSGEYAAELVLIALAEPDLGSKKLNVTLMGRDAVGQFALKRSYKFAADDFGYTTELAALVALGTLEGRWKAIKARPAIGGGAAGSMPLQPVQLTVEFRSLPEWLAIQRQIVDTPGVEDLQVAGQSGRSADIAVRFPGGGTQLANSLASQGLDIREVGGAWVVRGGGG